MIENVILVDVQDNELGTMEKMKAHEEGLLHRAFSVFIFNSDGEILLQQRNLNKYHSGGLWSNTCCSHPRPGERVIDGANRRLIEEMGMDTELLHAFSFVYKSELDNELTEHELDHVYFGYSNQPPIINKDEVESYRYIDPYLLQLDISNNPNNYTTWLKICLDNLINHIKNN
ncbi:MAG: isopentenyl-diphosphate Delta-isomerase [Vicingaceae bacterium]|nr:isopentenyl-diphosphate Delta-isomerase [Vicingaceae bacterium]